LHYSRECAIIGAQEQGIGGCVVAAQNGRGEPPCDDALYRL
jgi:hypothetical protein